MSKTIQKITTSEEWKELSTQNKQVVLYFTILDSEDEFTKNILDTMYKSYEEFIEKDDSETKFAVLDLIKSEELATELKCEALSSFHGFIENKLVSKTERTKEISDLSDLMSELADPASILPYKVKSQEEFDNILKENELVVCDFTATWCGPCQRIGPKFKAMAKKQKSENKNSLGGENLVKFIKVEQTENKEIIEKAGVSCYPSFYFYKNGEKMESLKVEGCDEERLGFNIKVLIDDNYKEIHYAEFVETKTAFDNIVKENDVVFVDFTASWCPPCKMIKPIFEELAEEHKDKEKVKFVKIDVDNNEEVSTEYSVRSMPTFKVFKDGQEVQEDGFGGASVDKLKKMVEKYTKN